MAGSGTWKVDYQTETVGLGPDGRPTEGVKVGFHTIPDNINGTVFIPKVRYNANTVKAAIQEQYAHIIAVHNLSS